MSAFQKQMAPDNELYFQAFPVWIVLPDDWGESPICRKLAGKYLYKFMHKENTSVKLKLKIDLT